MARMPKHSAAAPTIGHLKSRGVTGARIFCGSNWCGHMIVIAFDDLGLSDQTPFPTIKTHRRWTCKRCSGRDVSIMPDWPEPQDVQAERMG